MLWNPWGAEGSTEILACEHQTLNSEAEGEERNSDRLPHMRLPFRGRSISSDRWLARRTPPNKSTTRSASRLDSNTAPNAAPSKSCVISARDVDGRLPADDRRLPLPERMLLRRFGILALPPSPHDPIAAEQRDAKGQCEIESEPHSSNWKKVGRRS